jgi:FkbM family methyltransferase
MIEDYSMALYRNTIKGFKLLAQPQHRKTVTRLWSVYTRPIEFLKRYISKSGTYPTVMTVIGNGKQEEVKLFGAHDLDTLNQIYCRNDYPVDASDRVFIDIGANIGIATKYFLSGSTSSIVYAYEPVPRNVERYLQNCNGQEAQIRLSSSAVSDFSGTTAFLLEETGRYGSIQNVPSHYTVSVNVVNITDVLDEVLKLHKSIDVLKVDVEGTEETILKAIKPNQLKLIRKIYAEYQGDYSIPNFSKKQYGNVTHYVRNAEG